MESYPALTSFAGIGMVAPYFGYFHQSMRLWSSLDTTTRALVKKYAFGFSQDYERQTVDLSGVDVQNQH